MSDENDEQEGVIEWKGDSTLGERHPWAGDAPEAMEEPEDDFNEFFEEVSIHVENHRCEQDFIRLPGLMATYGRRVAHATRDMLRAKREHDHTEARLYNAKRREMEDDPTIDGRVTEARIDAAVKADAEWIESRERLDEAMVAKAEVQARFDALRSKETALQSLAATYRAEAKLTAY